MNIKWNIKPEKIKRLVNEYIKKSDKILKIINENNIKDLMQDYILRTINLNCYISFFQYISPKNKLREFSMEYEKKLSKYSLKFNMNFKILNFLKIYIKKNKLKGEDLKFVDDLIKNLIKNGCNLKNKERKEFIKIKKKIINLESKFINNLNNNNDFIKLSKNDLSGLNNDFLSIQKKENNKYIIYLKKTNVIPILKYCENQKVRKKINYKYNTRAKKNNKILLKIIYLKKKLSEILGYTNHVNLISSDLMAKNNKNIQKFLKKIQKNTDKLFNEEIEILRKEKNNDKINMWDVSFYINKYKENYFKLDEEELRYYFPLNHVVKKMFEIFEKLFNIKILKYKTNVWHKDVNCYKIIKKNKTLSYFYFDLFPRKNKYGHAACFTLESGSEDSKGNKHIPVSAVVCNFTIGNKKIPSCLSIEEVNTLFHEFGHCIHNSFGHTKYALFSGTSVERDFVEMPSQIIENWIYNKEILNIIGKHYKTKQKINSKTIDLIIKLKNLFKGFKMKIQIVLSKLDNTLHSNNKFIEKSQYQKNMIKNLYHYLSKEVYNNKIKTDKRTNMATSFGHLAGGYDGMYYSYLWSKVISNDIYNSKFKNNILNNKLGEQYIKNIISKGGSEKAEVMIKNFLGRKYKFNI
jgi:thimet oligopeptidase